MENSTEVKVESVKANNLKTFTVTLNQEIDKDTVKLSAKIGTGSVLDSFQVLDDNKTIVGVYNGNGIAQSSKVDFTLSAKTKDGSKEIKDYQTSVVVTDTALPTFTGATALNAKQIELQFSEAINLTPSTAYALLNDIKINDQAAVAQIAVNPVKNTVTLTFANVLPTGKHTVEVANLKDFANFKVAKASFDVTVTEDTAAPVATAAEVISKDKVRVTFNETVATKGDFKLDGNVVTGTTNVVPNTDGKVWEISGLNLGLGAIVEVKIEYKGQKDVLGNEVKEFQAITAKATDDTVAPTVAFAQGDANKVTLNFSKSMKTNTGKVTVLDKDGKKVKEINVTTFKANSDNKVLELTGAQLGLDNVNPANYTLEVTDMKDASVRENVLAKSTFSFTAQDTEKPTVQTDYLVTAGKDADGTLNTDKDTITIYFSEAMDKASAESLSNYFIGASGVTGTPLSSDVKATSATLSANGKSVVIGYKGATNLTSEVLKAASLKDVAGNIIAGGVSGEISKIAAASQVLNVSGSASDYKVTDKNTVSVKFNTKVGSVAPSAFTLYEGGNAITGFSSAVVDSNDSTGRTVKFTSPVALDTDADKYTLRVNDATAVKNIFGSSLTKNAGGTPYAPADTIALVDKVNPEIAKVKKSTSVNSFDITFSEAMNSTETVGGTKDILAALANSLVVTSSTIATPLDAGDLTVTTSDNKTYKVAIDPDKLKITSAGTQEVSFTLPNPTAAVKDSKNNRLSPVTSAQTVTIDVKTSGEVAAEASLALINSEASTSWSTVDEDTFTDAGVTGVTSGNLTAVKASVKADRVAKTTDLSKAEVQTSVDNALAVEAAKTALNTLTVATPTAATSSIALPATGTNGTTITWKIKTQTSSAIAGSVNAPLTTSVTTEARTTGALETVIEATITKGSATATKDFTIAVPAGASGSSAITVTP